MVCIEVIFDMIKKVYEVKCTCRDAGVALAGATVTLISEAGVKVSLTTGSDGVADFKPVKKGTYQATASHPEYEDLTKTVTVPAV